MLYHLSYTPERAPNATTTMPAIPTRAATMTAIMALTVTIAMTFLAATNG